MGRAVTWSLVVSPSSLLPSPEPPFMPIYEAPPGQMVPLISVILPVLCQARMHFRILSSVLMATFFSLLPGSQVLSTPASNWLVPWLPASLLGLMVIAAALLIYLRSWRKAGQ